MQTNSRRIKKLLTGDVIDELKKLSSTFQILGQVSDEAWKFGYRSLVNLVNPSKRCLRILRKNQKYLKRYAIIRVELAQDVPIHSLDHGDLYTEMLNRITCKRWGKENYCYRQEEHEQDHLPQPPVAANFQPPSFLYL